MWTTDGSKLTRGGVDRASGVRFCRSKFDRRFSVSAHRTLDCRADRSLGPISAHASAWCSPLPAIEPRLMMLEIRRKGVSFPSRHCPRIEILTYWPALRFLNSVRRSICQSLQTSCRLTDDSPRTKSWVKVISPRTLVWNMMSISSSSISPTCSFPYTKPACIARCSGCVSFDCQTRFKALSEKRAHC